MRRIRSLLAITALVGGAGFLGVVVGAEPVEAGTCDFVYCSFGVCDPDTNNPDNCAGENPCVVTPCGGTGGGGWPS